VPNNREKGGRQEKKVGVSQQAQEKSHFARTLPCTSAVTLQLVTAYVAIPLFEQGLQLITRRRKNMKNRLMHLSDKLLLRKRAIIEAIIDQLKHISQIEHSRHRSPINFVVHLLAGLIAYSHQDKKPSLHLDEHALLAA
jgi:hypothetical protein